MTTDKDEVLRLAKEAGHPMPEANAAFFERFIELLAAKQAPPEAWAARSPNGSLSDVTPMRAKPTAPLINGYEWVPLCECKSDTAEQPVSGEVDERIVDAVMENLADRRGIFDGIDDDVMQEIRESLRSDIAALQPAQTATDKEYSVVDVLKAHSSGYELGMRQKKAALQQVTQAVPSPLPERVVDVLMQTAGVSTLHPDGSQLEKLYVFAELVQKEVFARTPQHVDSEQTAPLTDAEIKKMAIAFDVGGGQKYEFKAEGLIGFARALLARSQPVDDIAEVYGWLQKAARSGLPGVENGALTLMAFYQGAEFPSSQPVVAVSDERIADTTSARNYLIRYMLEHFMDRTFTRYIQDELASDFAYQLARALLSQPAAPAQPENIEADAYMYACDLMEQFQKERAERGVEIGTTGSLCDGIAWVYDRIKKLETGALSAPAAPAVSERPTFAVACQLNQSSIGIHGYTFTLHIISDAETEEEAREKASEQARSIKPGFSVHEMLCSRISAPAAQQPEQTIHDWMRRALKAEEACELLAEVVNAQQPSEWNAAIEAAAKRIKNGSFLHENSPAAQFAKEAEKAILELKRPEPAPEADKGDAKCQ